MSTEPQHVRERGRSHANERVTFRLPEPLLETVDEYVDAGRYPNRSEAIRDAVRETFPEGCGPR